MPPHVSGQVHAAAALAPSEYGEGEKLLQRGVELGVPELFLS